VDIFEYSGVLKDYLDLLALNRPSSLLEKHKVRYVLFPPNEPLTYVLEHDAGWKVLYRDKISVLLRRADDVAGAGVSGALDLQRLKAAPANAPGRAE
jgi:hypothetical protein